jgi:hypothetical protein
MLKITNEDEIDYALRPNGWASPAATDPITNRQNGCSTLAAGRVGCKPCWAAR